MDEESHDLFHILKANILQIPSVNTSERRIWIRYRNAKHEDSKTYVKIFRLRNVRIVPNEDTGGYCFQETIMFEKTFIGLAMGTIPQEDIKNLSSKKDTSLLQQAYWKNDVPDQLFIEKKFTHRLEK